MKSLVDLRERHHHKKGIGSVLGKSSTTKAARFRKLLDDRRAARGSILCPTAHDCVSAKMIEHCGFEFLNVAGAAPTACWTGEPECGVVTSTEMISVADKILSCVNVPGKANIAQGGNAMNVIRSFRGYERAGAVLIQLEDQGDGHLSGFIPGKRIISEEEMVGKIKAARYAREDADVVIAVRTDAKLALGGGLGEAVRRCKVYADAGAEALMPHGIETREEWESVARELEALRLPLIASLSAGLLFTPKGQPRRELLQVADLEQMGWTIFVYANHLLHIQMTHSLMYLESLRKVPHDISGSLENVIDNGIRNSILGLSEWRAVEEAFVPSEEVKERYKEANPLETYVYSALGDARDRVRKIMEEKRIKPL